MLKQNMNWRFSSPRFLQNHESILSVMMGKPSNEPPKATAGTRAFFGSRSFRSAANDPIFIMSNKSKQLPNLSRKNENPGYKLAPVYMRGTVMKQIKLDKVPETCSDVLRRSIKGFITKPAHPLKGLYFEKKNRVEVGFRYREDSVRDPHSSFCTGFSVFLRGFATWTYPSKVRSFTHAVSHEVSPLFFQLTNYQSFRRLSQSRLVAVFMKAYALRRNPGTGCI